MKSSTIPNNYTRQLVFAAILLAFALVVNYYTKTNISIGGAQVLQITFGGPFIKMAALVLGPLYGGICGALSDVIGHFLKPQGGYLWPLTVTAFLHNAAIGLLWKLFKRINTKLFNAVYIVLFSLLGTYGLINIAVMNLFTDTAYYTALFNIDGSMKFAGNLSLGLFLAGVVGLVIHFVAWFVTRKSKDPNTFDRYLRLMVCVMLPSLLNTTVNTYIFKYFGFYSQSTTAFGFVWILRLMKEVLNSLYNIYVLTILLKVYESVSASKQNRN